MELHSHARIKEIMAQFGVAPNKKFGQNFLLDEHVLQRIASHASGNVLEIGPGMGALTHYLALSAEKVVSIEIDAGMVKVLKETQGEHQNLTVLHGDVLDHGVLQQAEEILGSAYTVIANLPYYITTPIIMEFLEKDHDAKELILMMQKEVASRICALPGTKDYGVLSVAVQYYTTAQMLFLVKPGSFYPRPNVDSCVIKLEKREKPPVMVQDKKLFFRVVKACFAMRRKTILNNLAVAFSLSKENAKEILQSAGIDSKRRGETLTMEEFARLTNGIFANSH